METANDGRLLAGLDRGGGASRGFCTRRRRWRTGSSRRKREDWTGAGESCPGFSHLLFRPAQDIETFTNRSQGTCVHLNVLAQKFWVLTVRPLSSDAHPQTQTWKTASEISLTAFEHLCQFAIDVLLSAARFIEKYDSLPWRYPLKKSGVKTGHD